MTRNRAIELRGEMYAGSDKLKLAALDVDNYVKLGMLHLDDDEGTPEAALRDVLIASGLRGIQQRFVIDAIHTAGLKVVRKLP